MTNFRFKGLWSLSYREFAKKIMKLPKLGDSISDATVLKFHKNVGDAVQPDEIIAEVETDKVNVEIKAEAAGVITKLFAAEKQKVDVGADFLEYDTEGKGVEKKAEAPKQEASKKSEAPKQESPKQEAPRKEDPKQEAPKKGAQKAPPPILRL
jgi:2-oxoglutarate dehydrogenase E2 component (dihydrolipoamide succinyltransferase)